jgi:hypothetical protein
MIETVAKPRDPITLFPDASPGVRPRLVAVPAATPHPLSETQLAAIRAAMQLFVDDDLDRGVTADQRLFCDACERVRPAAGSIRYDRYLLCNNCGIEYEVARARGLTISPGQYVRDKRFGETKPYLLEEV